MRALLDDLPLIDHQDPIGDRQIDPVHQYLPVLGHIETLKQTSQGRFSRAGRPGNADKFTGFDLDVQVAKHFLAILIVAKPHALDGDTASGAWINACSSEIRANTTKPPFFRRKASGRCSW